MKNKRSIIAVLITITWLPWLLARILSRPRDIVCGRGEELRAVTVETAGRDR